MVWNPYPAAMRVGYRGRQFGLSINMTIKSCQSFRSCWNCQNCWESSSCPSHHRVRDPILRSLRSYGRACNQPRLRPPHLQADGYVENCWVTELGSGQTRWLACSSILIDSHYLFLLLLWFTVDVHNLMSGWNAIRSLCWICPCIALLLRVPLLLWVTLLLWIRS